MELSTEQRESCLRWWFLGRNATTPWNTTRLQLLQATEQNELPCRHFTSTKTFPWLSWLPPDSPAPPSVQLSWSWSEVHSAMSPDTLQYEYDTCLRPTGNRVRVTRSVLGWRALLDVLSYLYIAFFYCCSAVLQEAEILTSESKPARDAAGRTLNNDLLLWIYLCWTCKTEEEEQQQQQQPPCSFLMCHFLMTSLQGKRGKSRDLIIFVFGRI